MRQPVFQVFERDRDGVLRAPRLSLQQANVLANNPQQATHSAFLFGDEADAIQWIEQNGDAHHVYTVLQTDGHQEYTIEVTQTRKMHRLPQLVGS